LRVGWTEPEQITVVDVSVIHADLLLKWNIYLLAWHMQRMERRRTDASGMYRASSCVSLSVTMVPIPKALIELPWKPLIARGGIGVKVVKSSWQGEMWTFAPVSAKSS
jgi:hypothetical protein